MLHPHHKLSYFRHAGWTNDWIATVKKLVRDEYDCSYCFWADIVITATGPEDESKPLNKIFDSLLAFCEPPSSATASDKLKCYITKGAEDMKNEDVLMWWHKHKTLYPHLHRMAFDYQTVSCKSILAVFALTYSNLHTGVATSVDMEHVFSQGHLLLPYICNHLSSESTHALLCLSNLCLYGCVKDTDIRATTLLPDINGKEPPLETGWDNIWST